MIKAEAITHEGSAGPNWLEHCREIFTPPVVTSLVVVFGIVLIGLSYTKHHSALSHRTTTPTTTSQQSGFSGVAAPGLQVLPSTTAVVGSSTSNSLGSSSLQPANNAGDAAGPGATGAPSSTPANPVSNPVGPAPSDSASALQQTVQTAQSVLNGATNLLPKLPL